MGSLTQRRRVSCRRQRPLRPCRHPKRRQRPQLLLRARVPNSVVAAARLRQQRAPSAVAVQSERDRRAAGARDDPCRHRRGSPAPVSATRLNAPPLSTRCRRRRASPDGRSPAIRNSAQACARESRVSSVDDRAASTDPTPRPRRRRASCLGANVERQRVGAVFPSSSRSPRGVVPRVRSLLPAVEFGAAARRPVQPRVIGPEPVDSRGGRG